MHYKIKVAKTAFKRRIYWRVINALKYPQFRKKDIIVHPKSNIGECLHRRTY